MIRQILWDWNGTLLDDLQYSIDVRARSFPAFGLTPVKNLEEYYRQFTFPVRQYYRSAGVTDELFDEVAHAWIAEYERGFSQVRLFPDAAAALESFLAAGIRQVILSATKFDLLQKQVARFPIGGYFDTLLGLSDIYGNSKEAIARQYLESSGFAAEETCMIGDTLHDAEVARAIGSSCVLVSRGHQNPETLRRAGVPVVPTLEQASLLIRNYQ